MPLRAFRDRLGTQWEVWEAHAALEDRRTIDDRRSEPRKGENRRDLPEQPVPQKPEPGEGWLVFRCDHARRRHIPIPPAWERMRDEELEALMTVARPSGPRSRITE